ncbi:MAG: hypothetical protein HYW13_01665, partial [Planctomycetes bacterium]|nr:hypothetical protein [Planctomycetota bacterium]
MRMRRNLLIALWIAVIAVGLGHKLTKAADVQIILGTSSGFNVVRGTSVSAGTSTFFVG